MHPLLQTLDLTPSTRTESSVYELHPIRNGASARSRGIPLILSLGLTPLLIYGLALSLIPPSSLQGVHGAFDQAQQSVSLMLQEPILPNPQASQHMSTNEGKGHPKGTGTLDPRLAAYTSSRSLLSDSIGPDDLSTSPRAEQVDLSLSPGLPLQVGSNGLGIGTGREAATFDFSLIPIKRVMVRYQLRRGESISKEPVKVRILVGDDGVPLQATVVSGPVRFHEEALIAARKWRFEPLAAHGLKAPVSSVITFFPEAVRPT